MSDQAVAACGRNLAKALAHYAYERDPSYKKQIAEYQTELVKLVDSELRETPTDATPGPTPKQ